MLMFIYMKKVPQNDTIIFVFICVFVYIIRGRRERPKSERGDVLRSSERILNKLLTLVTSGRKLELEMGIK